MNGLESSTSGPPRAEPNSARCVVLRHLPADPHPPPHFDLMIERDGSLCTWRLQYWSRPLAAEPAERIADHRTAFLDFEGALSGGRGAVSRVFRGTLAIRNWSPQRIEGEFTSIDPTDSTAGSGRPPLPRETLELVRLGETSAWRLDVRVGDE